MKLSIEFIKDNVIDTPSYSTMLGDQDTFYKLPKDVRANISFLNAKASALLLEFVESNKIINGPMYKPFEGSKFELVEKQKRKFNNEHLEWFESLGIEMDEIVFVVANYDELTIMTNWRTVIELSSSLFFADDILLFSTTGEWALVYYHEDEFMFAR